MRDAAAAVRTASRATVLAPAGNRSGAPSVSAQREISTGLTAQGRTGQNGSATAPPCRRGASLAGVASLLGAGRRVALQRGASTIAAGTDAMVVADSAPSQTVRVTLCGGLAPEGVP